jgi:hypothetical protein
MKIIKLFTFLLAISFSWIAAAQDKPYFYASQTSTIEAVVEEINQETRVVTVRKSDGTAVTFIPSPDVKNLDQVSVGDILHAEMTHSVRITVSGAEGVEPGAGGMAGIARSEKGEMPAMAAVDATVIVATVEAIDVENGTYKLKGPAGNVNEYVALNPENLKLAAVGDIVIIETTDSIVAAVEKVTPAE